MSVDTRYAWDDPKLRFPTLAEAWVDACKQRGNPLVLMDTMGTRLRAKQALTGSIVLGEQIAALNPEQNVGLLLPTSAGGMITNLACLLQGKTVINLNFTASLDALLSSIEQTGIRRVFTSERFLQRLRDRGVDVDRLQAATTLVPLESLRGKIGTLHKLATLLRCFLLPAGRLKKRYLQARSPQDTAVILFSSGSEGAPKGIMLSHNNLMANVNQVVDLLCFTRHDVLLANLPLFHAFGLTATLFLPLLNRQPVLCHPDPTDAPGIARAIQEHKVSVMFATSTFLRLYIRNSKVSRDMLESLRLVVAGAEKLQPEVREDFRKKFGKAIYEGYGTSETAPVASVNLPETLALEVGRQLPSNKEGSVGRPIPGTRIRAVDPETKAWLPPMEAGLLLISGPQVMQGYLNSPGKTDEVLLTDEGRRWYATGDKGYVDDDGFVFIIDRYSRFAKISGEMVGLGKVEEALRTVVNNHDIDLLAMNVPDSRKGEKIVILSTAALDGNALRTELLAQGLTPLALPATYYQVDEIPTLGSGKRDFAGARALALNCAASHGGTAQ